MPVPIVDSATRGVDAVALVNYQATDPARVSQADPVAHAAGGPAGPELGACCGGDRAGPVAATGEMEHVPAGSLWACLGCGLDWPCPPAREGLARQFAADPVQLSVYMSEQLYAAVRDLFRCPPDQLWSRFIAWTGPMSEPMRSAIARAAELRLKADRR